MRDGALRRHRRSRRLACAPSRVADQRAGAGHRRGGWRARDRHASRPRPSTFELLKREVDSPRGACGRRPQARSSVRAGAPGPAGESRLEIGPPALSTEPVADDPASFVMEQFRVAGDGGLEIQGTWNGVPGADLDQPVLVLHFDDRIADVDADRVRGTARKWYASFPWTGDAGAIRKALLHVGGRLRVDLGPHPTSRRRLGRTALPAVAVMPLAAPMPELTIEPRDLLSTHTELAALRDRLAAVEEEAARARENARRAEAEAERARDLRERESDRLRDAMNALRRTAHETVEAERERLRLQAVDLERLRGEGRRLEEVEAERDEARAERDEARRLLADARAALEEARQALELVGDEAE